MAWWVLIGAPGGLRAESGAPGGEGRGSVGMQSPGEGGAGPGCSPPSPKSQQIVSVLVSMQTEQHLVRGCDWGDVHPTAPIHSHSEPA